MDTNIDFSLVFVKILDNSKSCVSFLSNDYDQIDYVFKFEFYLNENKQIILGIDIGIEFKSDRDESIVEILVKTSYLLNYNEILVNAQFADFLPILNDTFTVLEHSAKEKMSKLGLTSLEKPEFSEYSTEFMRFKTEFLRIYFPSVH